MTIYNTSTQVIINNLYSINKSNLKFVALSNNRRSGSSAHKVKFSYVSARSSRICHWISVIKHIQICHYRTIEIHTKIVDSSIAVPGELHGYWTAFTKFGSGRITWKRIFEPAIKLAREGFPVSSNLAMVLQQKESDINEDEDMRSAYLCICIIMQIHIICVYIPTFTVSMHNSILYILIKINRIFI